MNEVCRRALAGCFLGLMWAAHTAAEPLAQRVNVRVVDSVGVETETWSSAETEISRIFRHAGIELTCEGSSPSRPPSPTDRSSSLETWTHL
jgi:hypothetical protein